jgi:PIN domain
MPRVLVVDARTDQLARAVPALIAAFSATLAEAAAAMSFPLPARAEAALSPPSGVYDCVYIALAKQERTTLVTADRRQAEIARTLNVPVSTI